VALGLPGLYAGDYLCARYRIPGDRQTLGSVQVSTLYAVRQKSGRIEYSLGDTETEPCVRSLLPHLGYVPCWYLRRHATKRIEIGRVDQSKCRGCARGPTARARAPRRSFHAVARRVRAALPASPWPIPPPPGVEPAREFAPFVAAVGGARAPAGARRHAGWRNALSDWPGRTGKVGLAPDRWRADRARGTSVERRHCVRVAQVSGNAVLLPLAEIAPASALTVATVSVEHRSPSGV
jgi:hypothetical protein